MACRVEQSGRLGQRSRMSRLLETHRAHTRTRLIGSSPEHSTVTSVAGFVRGTHVRIPVSAGTAVHRIVAVVDVDAQAPLLDQPGAGPASAVGAAAHRRAIPTSRHHRKRRVHAARLRGRGRLVGAIRRSLARARASALRSRAASGPAAAANETSAAGRCRWPPAASLRWRNSAMSARSRWPQPLAAPLDAVPLSGGHDGLAALSVRRLHRRGEFAVRLGSRDRRSTPGHCVRSSERARWRSSRPRHPHSARSHRESTGRRRRACPIPVCRHRRRRRPYPGLPRSGISRRYSRGRRVTACRRR